MAMKSGMQFKNEWSDRSLLLLYSTEHGVMSEGYGYHPAIQFSVPLFPLRNGGGAADPTAYQNTHKCPDSRAADSHCELQVKSEDVGVSATPPLVLHLHDITISLLVYIPVFYAYHS